MGGGGYEMDTYLSFPGGRNRGLTGHGERCIRRFLRLGSCWGVAMVSSGRVGEVRCIDVVVQAAETI